MLANPLARTLAALGFHAHHEEDVALRPVFADANGEMPTPVEPPPPRIPPHQRHLYVQKDDALRGYSLGSYRPAATLVGDPSVSAEKPAKKAGKAHKTSDASPLTA
jgi:hypothetical protein